MGRKRQTRKRTDRVNSKTSLNSGNVSSDSISETSLVSRKESLTVCGQKTLANGSADTDCNAPTQPTGASSSHTSFGQHCFTGQTVHDERALMSFDHSVSQENIPSENMQPAQPDHGQHHISVPSDDYDTDQTTQRLPVNTGLGRFVSQLNSRREFTLSNAQPDTPLQSTSLSGETADTDQTIHAHSTGTRISCGQGRGYLMSHETQRGKNTSYAQADHGLQSTLESGVNSDTDHGAYSVNPIRNDTLREYSGSQGVARGDAVLSNAQAGVGLRSSAQTVQNSQAENLGLRAGSGDDTSSLQNNGGPMTDMTSILQNFCALISQQNETHNAQVRQQNETHNAQVVAQNALISQLDDRISKQNESQNNMMRECLTGITNVVRESTNVVRENNTSVNQCINGIAGQLSNLTGLIQSREATHANVSSVLPSTVPSRMQASASTVAHEGPLKNTLNSSSAENPSDQGIIGCTQGHSSLQSNRRIYNMVQNDISGPGNVCGQSGASVLPSDNHDSFSSSNTQGTHNTASNPRQLNIQNTNNAASTSGSYEQLSRNRNVKLPAFTGNGTDSWKVWFSRFTTVADLNNWDDPTRLSELVQRLQGTAADFVFDEIPNDIISSFQSLVHELGLRFQSVETTKTFRVQFGKRTQRIGESVEDYSAELKRIYDKAYPGRNPEMRQQLLLQQFLNGLRNKQAKFAVEYFKEPCTIEDAVHHVVTYMEAQQGAMCKDRSTERRSKSVIFKADTVTYEGDDDRNEEENQKRDSHFDSASGHRKKQIVRRVQTAPPDSSMLSQILNYVAAAIAERETCHESKSNKTQVTPRSQDQLSSHDQLRPQNQNQGQTHRQGQMRPHLQGQGQSAGQNRLTNVQCFHCANFGHFKRECPFLLVQQKLNGNSEPPGTEPQEMQRTPLGGQRQGSSLNTGSDIESRQAVPQLKSQNIANLNVSEFNHETMVRRVSTLVSTRNSKILSRHDVRSPVRSCKTTTPNSVSKDRLSSSSSGSKINAHQDSLEIETATMGSCFNMSCKTETGTLGSSSSVSRKTSNLSVERPTGRVGQQTGSVNQKNGSTAIDVCPNMTSQHVAEERQLPDNENATRKPHCRDGLYVDGVINGVNMLFNIDTGATCTVISDRFYSSIPEDERPTLTRCTETTGASGQSLSIQGSATFDIELGSGQKFSSEIMVANIEDDGLLGHDLLRQGRAAILCNKNILRFIGASLPCIKISNSVPEEAKEP